MWRLISVNINMELSMERTEQELEEEWRSINWKEVERYVDRMQGKIFLATMNRECKKLKNLQKLARKSLYFHLFALRQITIVNQGKYTPGIDGEICISIKDRYNLLLKFRNFNPETYKPKPIRRVNIPKPNGGIRPLGIPTIFDRCVQMLYKLMLEPEFECRFHANSFGFRPGRCAQDAVELIKKNLSQGDRKYILDADIKGFFDNIEHNLILKHFQPHYRKVIRKWLTAKIIKDNQCYKPLRGTPQGGVISPLLANIALNEFDFRYNADKRLNKNKKDIRKNIVTIRYADDYVVISDSKPILERIKRDMEKYFSEIGLQFNQAKTRIVERSKGFNFLGFTFIKYPHSYLKVIPSRESQRRVKLSIKSLLTRFKQAKTDAIIYRLNMMIRGWAMYYRYCNAYQTFRSLDSVVFRWVWKWCRRRHPKKGKEWVANKYFRLDSPRKWMLSGEKWSKMDFLDIPRMRYYWRVSDNSPMNPECKEIWEGKPKVNDYTQVIQRTPIFLSMN